jgi:hypothetical protein
MGDTGPLAVLPCNSDGSERSLRDSNLVARVSAASSVHSPGADWVCWRAGSLLPSTGLKVSSISCGLAIEVPAYNSGVPFARGILLPSSSGFRAPSTDSISVAAFDLFCTYTPEKKSPSANAMPLINTPTPIPGFAPVLRSPEFAPPEASFVGAERSPPPIALDIEVPWTLCDELSRVEAENSSGAGVGVGVDESVVATRALDATVPFR